MKALRKLRRLNKAPWGVLLLALLACSLPRFGPPTPTPVLALPTGQPALDPTPTPLPPLPPALLESDPPPGGVLPASGAFTLVFNQPMDRPAVESALQGRPSLAGRFIWLDGFTVTFTPDQPFPPGVEVVLTIGEAARAANGLPLVAPLALSYRVAGWLQLSQVLPEPGVEAVDPTAAVVATFNQPVISLGGQDEAPAAFQLDPPAAGRGEWINTSTYAFYPQPALAGGMTYQVMLSPDLTSTYGSPLSPAAVSGQGQSWSFTTAVPRLLSLEQEDVGDRIPLDAAFTLLFNQPMDLDSLGEALTLTGPSAQPLPLQVEWDDDLYEARVQPDSLLERGSTYRLSLDASALSAGGTPLETGVEVEYRTVAGLTVVATSPAPGGSLSSFGGPALTFNAPLVSNGLERWASFQPAVDELRLFWDESTRTLRILGDFQPETGYTLVLDGGLEDVWGGTLGNSYQFSFRTEPLPAALTILNIGSAIFLTPDDSRLPAQATNLSLVQLTLDRLTLNEFLSFMAPGGYQLLENHGAEGARTWNQRLDLPRNQSQAVELALSPGGSPLAPGLYYLKLEAQALRFQPPPLLLVISRLQATVKASAQDALVWVVDLGSDRPYSGGPVALYNETGVEQASGRTDDLGIYQAVLPIQDDLFAPLFAVLGQPGDAEFGLAISQWDTGVAAWDFGLPVDASPPGLRAYLYTDRPIYRPGQSVSFRVVLREASNGRYRLPVDADLDASLYDGQGQILETLRLPLGAFGTAHGSFNLEAQALPGFYRIETPYGGVGLQVAEFRKPEIDLQVTLQPTQAEAGEGLEGRLQAEFFFGAPAGEVPVRWALYSRRERFTLPNYEAGPLDQGWLVPFWAQRASPLGELVASGEAKTDQGGVLELALDTPPDLAPRVYTLEATLEDESGFPVSGRATATVHPAPLYLGVRPDAWVGRAGEAFTFEVQAVDWARNPIQAGPVQAQFHNVEWERREPAADDPFRQPRFVPIYTEIASQPIELDEQGRGSWSQAAPEAGTYQVSVQFGESRTEVLVWVSGPGQARWPALPNQQLPLTADQDRYQPGEQAVVFVPNPFGRQALALVTLERGVVMDHWVSDVPAGGLNLSVPLDLASAPNVYLSVTLVGREPNGQPDFRQGYANLPVDPQELVLRVDLDAAPRQARPGDAVTLELRVEDVNGQPVEGEFSLAVVDLATLALAEPNADDIVTAFYGQQPLGVRTGQALAAYARRGLDLPEGLGGGGGGELVPQVREDFEDTALWVADVVTDAEGRAQVVVPLPDNLTRWQVQVRGVTAETLVGQAEIRIETSKDLIIQPVTPRFLVVGDHLEFAAVVHNNTTSPLEVQASLEAVGFLLDEPQAAVQALSLLPGGRQRVSWWGTVTADAVVDPVFRAQSETYQDAARPALGPLPVMRFAAPQTFATAGTLSEQGERLELVSLPRTFAALGGELRLELAPSLAAAAFQALESLEVRPLASTEQLISAFLPNLELLRVLQVLGLETTGLQARLDRTLNEGLTVLVERQNPDGGWNWWPGSRSQASDPYVSAYVLFGLARARQEGAAVPNQVILNAVGYIQSQLSVGTLPLETWRLDRLAFQHFVLASAGAAEAPGLEDLFDRRAQLSPWAQAFLALAWELQSPGGMQSRTLLSDLEASASRTASGAHWDLPSAGWQNMSTPTFNTAVPLYALAERNPASPLVADATRALVARRGEAGGWSSPYETAWSLLALTRVIRGTGEVGGDFTFASELNGVPLADGVAGGPTHLQPVQVSTPLDSLRLEMPNALRIRRGSGPGRLYYRAHLEVARSVETLPPSGSGLSIQRSYELLDGACPPDGCEAVEAARRGDLIRVRLTFSLEEAAYYLVVEDLFPAGGEALDPALLTSQQGGTTGEPGTYDPRRPFATGWGAWWFQGPRIRDNGVSWSANFLPAGTYQLTYTLVLQHHGIFRLLPARAFQFYFPEVQAHSGGGLFTIQP